MGATNNRAAQRKAGWLADGERIRLHLLGLPPLHSLPHVTNYLIKKVKLWSRFNFFIETD